MTGPGNPAALDACIAAVQRLLERLDDRGVIIGGVAVGYLAGPRFTADVDAVVLMPGDDVPRLLTMTALEGLTPRIANVEEFARRNRVVLLHHDTSGIDVDISLGLLPFEVEAVERSVIHDIGGLRVRLPTPEDLIIFKAVAHRPRDLDDIRAILDAHPNLDRERIRYWVPQFAEVLERPELWDDIAPWL